MRFFKDKKMSPKLPVLSTGIPTNDMRPPLQSAAGQKTIFGEKSQTDFKQKRQEHYVDFLYSLYFAKNIKGTKS